jgi:ABC-2 type transport system ATP-binding protein
LPEVEAICGRVMILDRGRLVSSGKPEELRLGGEGARGIWLEARVEGARLEALLRGVAGVREVTLAAPLAASVVRARVETSSADLDQVAERVFRAVADAGIDLRELKREDRSLEDVFARLTTHDEAASAAQASAS